MSVFKIKVRPYSSNALWYFESLRSCKNLFEKYEES